MSTPKKTQVFSIQDVLPDIIAKLSSGRAPEQVTIENTWKQLVGADAGRAVYAGIKDGNVIIRVDTPARLFQWKMRKSEVLKEFKKKCPEVINVFFNIGKVT